MYKDLVNKDAVEKLKELVNDVNVCMFCTDLDQKPFSTRPMAVREVDDQGNLWFISSSASHKNKEIKEEDDVQLIFSKASSSQFLSVYGEATIYRDPEKIKELWTPIASAWFEEGKEDPKLTVIKVSPSDAYYWDTPNGKIITLIKIAKAAITGKTTDAGEQGNLGV